MMSVKRLLPRVVNGRLTCWLGVSVVTVGPVAESMLVEGTGNAAEVAS